MVRDKQNEQVFLPWLSVWPRLTINKFIILTKIPSYLILDPPYHACSFLLDPLHKLFLGHNSSLCPGKGRLVSKAQGSKYIHEKVFITNSNYLTRLASIFIQCSHCGNQKHFIVLQFSWTKAKPLFLGEPFSWTNLWSKSLRTITQGLEVTAGKNLFENHELTWVKGRRQTEFPLSQHKLFQSWDDFMFISLSLWETSQDT